MIWLNQNQPLNIMSTWLIIKVDINDQLSDRYVEELHSCILLYITSFHIQFIHVYMLIRY